jgi:amino-acid N-acetyltransferase
MPTVIKYRLAESKDLEKIQELLSNSELPVADIDGNKIAFVVATNEKNELIGCVGLEQYDSDGLLRSLAVDSNYRGNGIGHELLSRLLSISRQRGVNDLHLLTTTAERFFERAGFSLQSRDEAPASIKSTIEFSSLCPSSSAYMLMRDIQKKDAYIPKDTLVFSNDKESGSAYWAIKGENLMLTHFEVAPDTIFAAHKHESEQITYVLEGELCFEIDNRTYRLKSGDTIIIPSDKLHKVWTDSHFAKAIDAWSPINDKYIPENKPKKDQQIFK